MNKIVYLFTGQGAQYVNMGKDLYDNHKIVRDIYERASESLKTNFAKICFESELPELSKTANLQPLIFIISACILELLKEGSIKPSAAAGFSLGEITALYASGMLSFDDTLKLIKKRGEVMDSACEASPGAMYSIIGLADEKLNKALSEASGYVIAANFNSPGQTVISGDAEAAEKAAKAALEMGAKRAMKLNVAGAFHSALMNYKKDEFKEFLKSLNFNLPNIELYSNLYGGKLNIDGGVNDFMYNYIPEQMSNPVRFRQETEELKADGYDTFIEIGVGKVLSGLVKRTVDGVNIYSSETCADIEKIINLQ